MDLQKVFQRFAQLLGKEPEEIPKLLALCSEACEEIISYVGLQSDNEENAGRLCSAAASLAFYKYTLCNAARPVSQAQTEQTSSSGQINYSDYQPYALYSSSSQSSSVSSEMERKKFSVSYAEKLWENAKSGIADICRDSNFNFKSVNKFSF